MYTPSAMRALSASLPPLTAKLKTGTLAMPMSIYRNVHAGPNTHEGGVHDGFFRSLYQADLPPEGVVSNPIKDPIINGAAAKI